MPWDSARTFNTVAGWPVTLSHALNWDNILEFNGLVPLQLWPSNQQLIRIMDQWEQYKFSRIKLKWTPIGRGPPKKVVVLNQSDAEPVIPFIPHRHKMWIVFPKRLGDINAGSLAGANKELWVDNGILPGGQPIGTAYMLNMKNPKPIMRYMDRPFSISFRAYTRNRKVFDTIPYNDGDTPAVQQVRMDLTDMKMPWMPLIQDRNVGAAANVLEMNKFSGHLLQLRQPFIAIQDEKTGQFLTQPSGNAGTWTIYVKCHLRKRRPATAPQVIGVDINDGDVLYQQQEVVNTWADPQVLW